MTRRSKSKLQNNVSMLVVPNVLHNSFSPRRSDIAGIWSMCGLHTTSVINKPQTIMSGERRMGDGNVLEQRCCSVRHSMVPLESMVGVN